MNNNNNEPQGGGAAAQEPVCPFNACQRQKATLRHNVQLYQEQAHDAGRRCELKDAEINRLVAEIAALNAEILRLKSRAGLHTQRTWHGMLSDGTPWTEVVRQCCREENMSTRPEWIHPDIRLVRAPEPEESEGESEDEDEDEENSDEDSDTSESLFVDQGEAALAKALGVGEEGEDDDAMEVDEPPVVPANSDGPFDFARLPAHLQLKVFKHALYRPGELIHCISRLDPFSPPPQIPVAEEGEEAPKPPRIMTHGFFWGKRACNINNDTRRPNEVLALLLVSKRFHWIGVHVFYGLNTFAFSSLGEFHRFCSGIGKARLARIQHLELTFTGNQYLTVRVPEGKKRIPFSLRTHALWAFLDTYRLKTLVVHINESGKIYIRRRYEPAALKELMARKTAGQPNQRLTRSMRTCQGMDYIYQLRGLEWIRFYDLHKAVKEGQRRAKIRDWSFIDDVNSTSTMPKVPTRFEASRLENLRPLLPPRGRRDDDDGDDQDNDWKPAEADFELIRDLFGTKNGRCSYDELRNRGYNRDDDVPSRGMSVTRTYSGSTRDSGSTGSSSSSSSSDTPDTSHTSDTSDTSGTSDISDSSSRDKHVRTRTRRLSSVVNVGDSSPSSSGSSSSDSTDSDSDSEDSEDHVVFSCDVGADAQAQAHADDDVICTGVTINLVDEEADARQEAVQQILADAASRAAMPPPPPVSVTAGGGARPSAQRASYDSLFITPAPGLGSSRPTPVVGTPAPPVIKEELTGGVIVHADEVIDLTEADEDGDEEMKEEEEGVIVHADEFVDLTREMVVDEGEREERTEERGSWTVLKKRKSRCERDLMGRLLSEEWDEEEHREKRMRVDGDEEEEEEEEVED